MPTVSLQPIITEFHNSYDEKERNRIWRSHSEQFRTFWKDQVLSGTHTAISDEECDKIIRILDRNGKGNTKNSVSVAKAMVAQGAWRRMMNEFHVNKSLGSLLTKIFEEANVTRKAVLLDELYKVNEGHKNSLTGPSGNAINAYLAAYDPVNNLSVISLKDRRALIEYLELPISLDWEKASVGQQIALTNECLRAGLRALGVGESAQAVSAFCYFPPMKSLWKGEHTVKRTDRKINVTVPVTSDGENIADEELEQGIEGEIRESMQIQALLAKMGTSMGYAIWLPKGDRGRVLKAWTPREGELLDDLPLSYESTTMKTVEQIDVIWLKKRTIVRAFEVEHTTSVYSGLLRMADLVALQPNISINLHIVAPESKRDKVIQEIQRPVFSLIEGHALKEICTFLSYDSVREIADLKHLAHLSHNVIEDYEERAEESGDDG
jgi:hypothetical protein